eukprot:CAMPEP_0117660140 /NCGR_PEP_ID=MMETSP0804-20121206/6808_1 /TAXON_ID=1074897 /ORGANISM="Tetraselmis astigmatica, Strain CCMP880" /LENGTH=405 /DNA_ID=CAMNT_0005466847 /DNA_START=411 /DNA_END=1628 /DNA_ORIENTATION=+
MPLACIVRHLSAGIARGANPSVFIPVQTTIPYGPQKMEPGRQRMACMGQLVHCHMKISLTAQTRRKNSCQLLTTSLNLCRELESSDSLHINPPVLHAEAPGPAPHVPAPQANATPDRASPKMLTVPVIDALSIPRFVGLPDRAKTAGGMVSSSTLWECCRVMLSVFAMQNACNQLSLKAKGQLLKLIQDLSYPSAVYVGNEPQRMEMDSLIEILEMVGPPVTLHRGGRAGEAEQRSATSFLGQWELLYASNAPLSRATPFSEAGKALGRLPGLGITDAAQDFHCDTSSPIVKAGSSATLGLGPLGSWKVSVRGSVKSNDTTGSKLSRASFDEVSISLADVMGFDFFGIHMPEVVVPVPKTQDGMQITSAWETTYLDDDIRITRGRTGAMFVYRKQPKKARCGTDQ